MNGIHTKNTAATHTIQCFT